MITNFWKNTKLHCLKHEEQPEMTITVHTAGPFYECPICHSKISVYDFEKMINHYQKVITDAYANNEEPHLENEKWKTKKKIYTVLEHKDNLFKVGAVINE